MSEIGFKKKIFEYFVWTRSKASVVGKTTEPDRDVVEPAPAAWLGGQAPVDVPGHVVSDQEEEGQEEAEQPDVPGVVKSLQTLRLLSVAVSSPSPVQTNKSQLINSISK